MELALVAMKSGGRGNILVPGNQPLRLEHLEMDMSKELTRDSWLFIVRGILAIAVGVLAFVYPSPTLAALIIVFGFYAVINGAFAVVAGLEAFTRPNWWLVAGGVAAIAIGFYAFFHPHTTA